MFSSIPGNSMTIILFFFECNSNTFIGVVPDNYLCIFSIDEIQTHNSFLHILTTMFNASFANTFGKMATPPTWESFPHDMRKYTSLVSFLSSQGTKYSLTLCSIIW